MCPVYGVYFLGKFPLFEGVNMFAFIALAFIVVIASLSVYLARNDAPHYHPSSTGEDTRLQYEKAGSYGRSLYTSYR